MFMRLWVHVQYPSEPSVPSVAVVYKSSVVASCSWGLAIMFWSLFLSGLSCGVNLCLPMSKAPKCALCMCVVSHVMSCPVLSLSSIVVCLRPFLSFPFPSPLFSSASLSFPLSSPSPRPPPPNTIVWLRVFACVCATAYVGGWVGECESVCVWVLVHARCVAMPCVDLGLLGLGLLGLGWFVRFCVLCDLWSIASCCAVVWSRISCVQVSV